MQVVKYKWMNDVPTLFLEENQAFQKMPLFDKKINFEIGKKTCIGYFKGAKHVSCPNKTEITGSSWVCSSCMHADDFFNCMRCDGSVCINEKQRNNCMDSKYFIYLAGFDSTLKVGISYEHRIIERLVEQGADLGAKIALVQDGKEVRLVEQKIRKHLNIVDRIRGAQKHNLIFGNPNTAAQNIFNAVVKLKFGGFKLIEPHIYDLRNYYRLYNIESPPKTMQLEDNQKLTGEIVAAKGNIMVIKNNDEFFSLNSHELIGRDLRHVGI